MYIFLFISTIFNGLVSTIAGSIVYFKHPHNSINKAFAIFCLCVAIWAFGYFFPLTQNSKELSLISFRLLHIGAVFIAVANAHLVCAVLGLLKEKKKLIIGGYLINVVFLCLIPTQLFIVDVVPKYDFNYWANPGIAYHFWLAFFQGYLIYTVYLLISYYKKSVSIKKSQMKYLLIGEIIGGIAGSTNFFLFYDINIIPYPLILTSTLFIAVAYVIIRYRFLDISQNLFKAFKYLFSLFFSVSTAYFIYALFSPIIEKGLPLIIILSVFLLSILMHFFLRLLNFPFIYQILHITNFTEFKDNIDRFLNKNIFYQDLATFEQDIQETFCNRLKISSAEILLITKTTAKKYPNLLTHFYEKETFLVTEELEMKQENDNEKFKFLPELQTLGEICFPLFHKKELIGLLILGQKSFGNSYTKEELDTLEHAAHYISLSLIITLYNQKLQQEIAQKTANLSKQNKKMSALLDQHSNFLEVSAHELNTPLTIARLHAELIPASKQVNILRFSLERLYERVRILIESNAYNKKSIKLKLKQVKIKAYFKKIFESFKPLIEKEDRHFHFENKIEHELEVAIDEFQIWIVLQNILINAKNFTPKDGLITLYLSADKKNIKIGIIDSGEGVPDKEKENIFKKFKSNHSTKGKGLGLGLYVARQIVRLHKGKIWCEDAPLKSGTAFLINLPRNLSS